MAKGLTAYRFNEVTRRAIVLKFDLPDSDVLIQEYGKFVIEVPDLTYALICTEEALRENFKFEEESFDESFFAIEPRSIREYLEIRGSREISLPYSD